MLLTQTYSKTLKNKKLSHLDNASKLFLATSTKKWSLMFRVAAVLKDEINPLTLQQAVDNVIERFPIINTTLAANLYWHYHKPNPTKLIIESDDKQPCRPILWRTKNAHMLRILYGSRRIAVEFFHVLSDGAGALVFLKTLLGEYLRLSGIDIPNIDGVLDPNETPSVEEMEDACKNMPLPKAKKYLIVGKAFSFSKTRGKVTNMQIIEYTISLSDLKNKATAIGVTLTEYLTAVLLYVSYLEQLKTSKKKRLPIRVSLPVNMRKFFPNESLRNCAWVVVPEIISTSTELTFENIALDVQTYLKEALKKENLFAGIALNMAVENNPFFKMMPLVIKNLAINIGYKLIGTDTATTTLSNLGVFNAPLAMMEQIETTEFMLGPANNPSICAALITTNDKVVLTFTSTEENVLLPMRFEELLNEQKIALSKRLVWQDNRKIKVLI